MKYYEQVIPYTDSARKNFYRLQQPGALHAVSLVQASISGFVDFIYTDATLQQVKSSGGMILIKNKAAVDSILNYDAEVKSALINEKVWGDLLISLQHELGGLLNMQPILETVGRSVNPVEQKALIDSLKANMHNVLLTHDLAAAGQVYNDLTYYEGVATLVKTLMTGIKTKAGSLILFLEHEYHLTGNESD